MGQRERVEGAVDDQHGALIEEIERAAEVDIFLRPPAVPQKPVPLPPNARLALLPALKVGTDQCQTLAFPASKRLCS